MSEQAVGPSAHPAVLLGIDSAAPIPPSPLRSPCRVLSRAEGPGSGCAPRSRALGGGHPRRRSRAATQANVTLPATLALVGAAGAGRPPEQEALADAMKAAGAADRVDVRGDTEIALARRSGMGLAS